MRLKFVEEGKDFELIVDAERLHREEAETNDIDGTTDWLYKFTQLILQKLLILLLILLLP